MILIDSDSGVPCRVEEKSQYFMGVDLGQAHDHTAIVVVRRTRERAYFGHRDSPRSHLRSEVYQVGFIERVPLHTPYPRIVSHVMQLLQRPTWAGNVSLAIDRTGVGQPVCDLFNSVGVRFKGVMISGGDVESVDNNTHRVPKMKLISQLQALLHEGKLQIQKELPEAPELVKELQEFRVSYTNNGHMQFGAREGARDDMVLALSLAVWDATKRPPPAPSFGRY
jgi:hypothetical protein